MTRRGPFPLTSPRSPRFLRVLSRPSASEWNNHWERVEDARGGRGAGKAVMPARDAPRNTLCTSVLRTVREKCDSLSGARNEAQKWATCTSSSEPERSAGPTGGGGGGGGDTVRGVSASESPPLLALELLSEPLELIARVLCGLELRATKPKSVWSNKLKRSERGNQWGELCEHSKSK